MYLNLKRNNLIVLHTCSFQFTSTKFWIILVNTINDQKFA